MDDLTSTISQILGDPQKMEQLRSVAESLGINTQQPPPQAPTGDNSTQNNNNSGGMPNIDLGALASIMQNFQGGGNAAPQGTPPSNSNAGGTEGSGGGLGATTLASLADILKTFNGSDKNVDLLRSLKPHFTDGRAGRIDDAVRIMQIIRAWPKIQSSGLLGSIGSLLGGGGK